MALGSNVLVAASPTRGFDVVAPVSMTAGWVTIIDAGGMTVQDAATITNPTTQITSSTRHILRREAKGTHLLLRMQFDDGLTSITDPVVKVFGRTGNQDWEIIKTAVITPADTATITTTSYSENGTDKFTTPDTSSQVWDCLGCAEVIVGIQTVLAGTGTASTAKLWAKFI